LDTAQRRDGVVVGVALCPKRPNVSLLELCQSNADFSFYDFLGRQWNSTQTATQIPSAFENAFFIAIDASGAQSTREAARRAREALARDMTMAGVCVPEDERVSAPMFKWSGEEDPAITAAHHCELGLASEGFCLARIIARRQMYITVCTDPSKPLHSWLDPGASIERASAPATGAENGGVAVLSEGLEVGAVEVDLVLAGEVSDAVGIAPAFQR